MLRDPPFYAQFFTVEMLGRIVFAEETRSKAEQGAADEFDALTWWAESFQPALAFLYESSQVA
jgi:hypothetical protein